MRALFAEGDLVTVEATLGCLLLNASKAEVHSFFSDGTMHLHTRSEKCGPSSASVVVLTHSDAAGFEGVSFSQLRHP